VREYNGTKRVQQAQARAGFEKEYAAREANGWSKRQAGVFAETRALAFIGGLPDHDGEHLPAVTRPAPYRQTKAGKTKDIDNAAKMGAILGDAIESAGPTHRALLVQAVAQNMPVLRQATALAKKGRVNALHGLRKSVRAIIDHRHSVHGLTDAEADGYFDTLVKIQAEIAFYQDNVGADWHAREIASGLPGHCARLGMERVHGLIEAHADWLSEVYGLAARHATDTDTPVELPSLITSAEIGKRHRISRTETRYVFPKGAHGIRAYDSTFIPRPRRTVEEAQRDAAFLREKDDVAKFHGTTRRTVNRWMIKGTYDDKLAEMQAAYDPKAHQLLMQREAELERAQWAEQDMQPVTPVTPITGACPAILIVDNRDSGTHWAETTESVTPDDHGLSRCTDFLRGLAEWKGIKPSSLRVYRKRGTLAALIEAYLDHLDEVDAAEAIAAMVLEEAA
jgi:hypothetical protein